MHNKSVQDQELRNQLTVIKNTIELMRGRAKYGTYEKFLEHLSRIENAVLRITEQLNDGHFVCMGEKYRKILVPYDGSKYSKEALNEAIEISKKFGSTLYLLTVVDISALKPPGMLLGVMKEKKLKKLSTEILKSVTAKANNMLQNEIDSCRQKGVESYYEVLSGHTVDSILKFANKNDIDLIVMGARGLSGVGKILALGSISRKVSEEAACPVMIVR